MVEDLFDANSVWVAMIMLDTALLLDLGAAESDSTAVRCVGNTPGHGDWRS